MRKRVNHYSRINTLTNYNSFQGLEDFECEVPEHFDGLDFNLLAWGMDTTQGGTIANHVHARIFLADETAFKTGMDGTDDGVVAEHALVGLYSHF